MGTHLVHDSLPQADVTRKGNAMSQDETAVNEAPASPIESAPVENTDDLDDFGDLDDELDNEVEETEGEDAPSEQAEETESQEEPQQEAEAPKEEPEQNKPDDVAEEFNQLKGTTQERIRQLANERREYMRQLEQLQAQQAQFATEQQLLDQINPDTGDYFTPDEVARIGAYQRLQQQQAMTQQQAYETQVRMSQSQLLEEGERALTEFPQFDSNSKEYDPELAKLVDPILEANTITDPNTGEVIGMRVSPYEILKSYADSIQRASAKAQTIGQAKAQQAQAKMLANVDRAPSASQATHDDDLDDFDRAWDEYA